MITGDDGARPADVSKLGDVAADAGLRRVHLLAWRDLEDPEAGGSELHAATIARLWAEAGIEVTVRTSFAAGRRAHAVRDGYRVVRRAGRYLVFPRAVVAELTGRHGPADGLVEVWNGMPFFSPLWSRVPSVAFLHHLHGEMWRMTLPPTLARIGELVEYRLAPPAYRRSAVVTLSDSARDELVERLRLRPDRVHVVPPGVDPGCTPGGARSPVPLVVAVGRLVPVKRFDLLVDVLVELRRRHPELQAVVVGDGYERDVLEAKVRAAGADRWLALPGRVTGDALVDLYRRAWVLAATSAREGWGMTITEAGACRTPAVATRVPGHVDAVVEGRTGLLADGRDGLVAALDRVLADGDLRRRLGDAAAAHAARHTWDATALGTLLVLAGEAHRRRRSA